MNLELESDLNEAEVIEFEKRGPGRPAGAKNKSTSRTEIRRRVAAHRERKRIAAEAEMEAAENSERLFRRLRDNGFCLFGEVAPGVNASTADEELMLAKEYCLALGIPADLRSGQTIRNFVIETLRAWVFAGSHPFNRETRTFAIENIENIDAEQYHVAGESESEEQERPNA
jgi:hypothetical protein